MQAEKPSLHYKTIHNNYTIGYITGNVHVRVYIIYFNFTEIGPLSHLTIKSLKYSIPMATRDKNAHMSVRACACVHVFVEFCPKAIFALFVWSCPHVCS